MLLVRLSERYAGFVLVIIVLFVALFEPPGWFYGAMILVLMGWMFADNHYYRKHLYAIKRAVELWSPLANSRTTDPLSWSIIREPLQATRDDEILQAVLSGGVPLDRPVMALLAQVAEDNPVPEGETCLSRMRTYWREWGKEHGYFPNTLQFRC